jgi:hypothetical protein
VAIGAKCTLVSFTIAPSEPPPASSHLLRRRLPPTEPINQRATAAAAAVQLGSARRSPLAPAHSFKAGLASGQRVRGPTPGGSGRGPGAPAQKISPTRPKSNKSSRACGRLAQSKISHIELGSISAIGVIVGAFAGATRLNQSPAARARPAGRRAKTGLWAPHAHSNTQTHAHESATNATETGRPTEI